MRKSLRTLGLTATLVGALLGGMLVAAPASAQRAAAAGTSYVPGTLRPSASQATQDAAVLKYWNFWKANFLSTK
ncbi:hypothetical protein [Kibdelosporangium phytohabitans]|uniref:hypothetical protein n=1 Tax=Kibdelosporangium phytohabitans TaxID=860235 RepID=UPI001A01DF5D|nr:hypothetical protein [Kibdelosporangium phytohabitans]MBE1463267.1 hypothetical protein [Kibdelosporangium phytohabitans]